jgi:hypothetical protein
MRGIRSHPIALAMTLAVAAGGCTDPAPGSPRPQSVTPDRGPVSVATPILIRGSHFNASAETDFAGRDESTLDARFAAYLGPVPLRDVRLRADGALSATVPEGLPIGAHDLRVVDPEGREGTLADAYRVLADTDSARLVAAFRIETVGPQEAWAPFTVTVTALDGAGDVVTAFNGAVSVTDLTGTAVPGSVGLFRDGAWTGTIEVRAPHAADVLTVSDASGLSATSNPFHVAPSPPVSLRFSTPPRTAAAGACSGPAQPLTVALRDAFGGDTVAEEALTLTAAAPPGMALYADDACAVPLAAPVIPAGGSSTTLWFRATLAGDAPLSASAPSLLGAAQLETILAGPPVAIAFVTPAQTVNAGACSQVATLELRDAWGNAAPDGAVTIDLAATAASGFAFYTDPACAPAGAVTQVATGAGSARVDLWFQGTVAEVVTVAASGAGLAGASQAETITPEGSASRLVFITPPRDTIAGGCSDIVTVQAQDSYGNAVTGAGAVQVSLSTSPAGALLFFADEACGVAIPGGAAAIAAGRSTVGFHVQGTAAGAVRVTASSTTLTSADQVEQVTAGPPARLAITSAPQSVTAGSCSGLASLALRDAWGNAATAGAPVPASLAATPGGGFTFFRDSLCTAPVTTATVAAGDTGTGFWFKGTVAGTVTVDATAAGLDPASQVEQIRPGAADRLAFRTAPQTVAAGACSGAVTVELRDANGNAATAPGATPLAISALPAAGFATFSDASCTAPLASPSIPAGSPGATFFFSATAAGPLDVGASSTGLAAATQRETVLPAPADRLVFTTAPATVTAGSCSATVGLEARDPYGNPSPLAAGATVSLDASPPTGLTFHAAAACGGGAVATVAIAPGASATSFTFSGTATGSVTVTASTPPLADAVQVETIVPLPAERLAFVTAPQSVGAGNCSQGVLLELHDALGNPAPAAAATTVSLSSTATGVFGFYSDALCTAPVAGVGVPAGGTSATFWFKGEKAEPVTVTASAPPLADATQVEQILSGGSASQLVVTTPARTTTAGGCSGAVTVEAQDAYGNPVASAGATPLGVSALPASGVTFYAGAGCTSPVPPAALELAPGTSSTSLWLGGTAAGTFTLTVSATGLTPATQVETVSPAAPDRLAFTTPARSAAAGACSAVVTLQARDAWGNASPVAGGATVDLSAAPSSGFGFYSDATCATSATQVSIPAGASSASLWFKGTVAGAVDVTASAAAAGLSPATQAEAVTAGPPGRLAFTSAPQALTAGTCSAATTLQSQDAYGNPSAVAAGATVNLSAAPSAGFTFYGAAGCTGAVTAVAIPAGGSGATFWFKATAAGSVVVTASATGLASATQTETVGAAAPDRLAFTTSAQSVGAGACSGPVTVQARDAYGNASAPAGGTAVGLAAAPSGGFTFFADAGCATSATDASIAPGATDATFWFEGTVAGSVTVTATVAGWTPASQAETVLPGATAAFAWDAVPTPQAQGRPFAVRIRAVDAYGNATPAFVATATLSLSVSPPVLPAPTLTCASGCTAGLTTGAFAAGVWTGSVSVSAPESPVKGSPDRWLVATSGAVSGASNAFELTGTPDRSPPLAKIVPTPSLIREGQSITFDASGSSDYQTPTASLQVSWDLSGTATDPPAWPTPAAPWTAWSTTKTVSNTYNNDGVYPVRVAVRDADGDVGYASATIEVRVLGTAACTVDTNSDVDDGAGSCRPWSNDNGTDGRVSLREALRLAVDGDTVNFATPMTISGTGAWTIQDRIRMVGPGVILDTKALIVADGTAAEPVEIIGLELTGQATAITVNDGQVALLQDVYIHDAGGIADSGTLTLRRVRMERCTGSCVTVSDTTGTDTLTVIHSTFRGAGTGRALDVAQCAAATPALSVQSSLFEGFQQAIRLGCPGTTTVQHGTFEANDTGIAYYAGAASAGHVLRNGIFSNQRTAAADCGLATFASRDYQQLWQNAGPGCLGGDPNDLAADPLYAFPAAGDFRLRMTSGAVDSAGTDPTYDAGLRLIGAFSVAPGPLLLGLGPDRGALETY